MTDAVEPHDDGDPFAEWFLEAAERGNPATDIDQRNGGRAWTEGNDVTVLIDGDQYFPELLQELHHTASGDWVYFTDLQSDGDEQLDGPGSEVGAVLADVARRGVTVRGLLWRSHPVGHGAAEVTNVLISRTVNDAGGEVVLDHRVRRAGSHHQKLVVIHRASLDTADEDVAFLGGIDLAHGRHDGPPHHGDPQPLRLSDARYGDRPPWHDVQLRIGGPAVRQVSWTFRERWLDPNPLDRPSPARALRHALSRKPPVRGSLAEPDRSPSPSGTHAVQVLRTYPARRPPYPFAPDGERSIARAYIKAFAKAREFIYLEDQYLWSLDATDALCAALRANPDLRCVVVIPRYPDPSGVLGAASRFGRWRVERALIRAGGDRVAIYDLENDDGTPIYVHAKVSVVDDTWMTVGSDNLNRRSWTHDSEICCAVMDRAGDLPRETRVRLAREHLDLPADTDDKLHDHEAWFDALRDAATALDEWHARGRTGARPRGRLRLHPRDRVSVASRPLLHQLHARMLDPDGRPRRLRERGRY
jgi:phosphatidylserine/phosphatidylglycerophosphate/cardiolipin synthase-like enzyme